MSKTILIITDNLPEQINGVVTTYRNIENCGTNDGYKFVYLTPENFSYIDCPGYRDVKLAWPRNMGKKIADIDPDYIHLATEGPLGVWARKHLSVCNIKHNTAYHTKFPEMIKTWFGIPEALTWPLVRWFHKHSGKVLTTTDTMVNELRSHGFDGDIIPWTRGVDRDIFYPSQRNNSGQLTLVCVSRISKEKNLEEFFQLDYPGACKIMVGDGPMLEEYKIKYPTIEFVGVKRGVELGDYYRRADVFVFPSRWETFGIVMIEAMACGTPVAAYPCQGPLDVVDEGITGCMNTDLRQAVNDALILDRQKVLEGSARWTWENAWAIFRNNLVTKV